MAGLSPNSAPQDVRTEHEEKLGLAADPELRVDVLAVDLGGTFAMSSACAIDKVEWPRSSRLTIVCSRGDSRSIAFSSV